MLKLQKKVVLRKGIQYERKTGIGKALIQKH